MNHSGLMEGYAGFFGGNGVYQRLNLVSQGSRLDVARPTNSGTICWRAWAAMPRDAEGSSSTVIDDPRGRFKRNRAGSRPSAIRRFAPIVVRSCLINGSHAATSRSHASPHPRPTRKLGSTARPFACPSSSSSLEHADSAGDECARDESPNDRFRHRQADVLGRDVARRHRRRAQHGGDP